MSTRWENDDFDDYIDILASLPFYPISVDKKALFEYAPTTFMAIYPRGRSLMVKHQPSKLAMRVRFPPPAVSMISHLGMHFVIIGRLRTKALF